MKEEASESSSGLEKKEKRTHLQRNEKIMRE